MPTGERSGVFVLDVDDLGALAKLEAAIGALPATKAVRTPSEGLHLYFQHAVGITNRPGALPGGIDVRGEGGYVLVPPSSGYRSETAAKLEAKRRAPSRTPRSNCSRASGKRGSHDPRKAGRGRRPTAAR
jgi:hypothetical protein